MASPRCHRARPQWPGVILEGVEDGDAGRALHVSPGTSQPCCQLPALSELPKIILRHGGELPWAALPVCVTRDTGTAQAEPFQRDRQLGLV